MKERAGHVPTPAAGFRDGPALCVGDFHERLVVSLGDDRGMVKFVSADNLTNRSERIVREQTRLTITEMKSPFGEACGVAKQARHRMTYTLGVLDGLAQHHVAAALAVHRMALGKL